MAQTSYRDRPLAGAVGQLYSVDGDHPNIRTGHVNGAAAIRYGNAVEVVPLTTGYVFEQNIGVDNVDGDTTKIWGIALHDHLADATEIAAGIYGARIDGMVNILRAGRVLVKPEASSGVVPGARLYVRKVAAGDEVLGALRGEADSTDCIDCTNQGQWITAPDADGLAVLECNFINTETGPVGPQGPQGEPGV